MWTEPLPPPIYTVSLSTSCLTLNPVRSQQKRCLECIDGIQVQNFVVAFKSDVWSTYYIGNHISGSYVGVELCESAHHSDHHSNHHSNHHSDCHCNSWEWGYCSVNLYMVAKGLLKYTFYKFDVIGEIRSPSPGLLAPWYGLLWRYGKHYITWTHGLCFHVI